jgi:hypothetical protein
MGFLSPWFLGGLLALALPLWLHRLERQAADRRPWSSLAFFRPSKEESVRRRRYRYLLLMACRLLLLTALCVLFARPLVDMGSVLVPPATGRHLIAIDTSLSMAQGDTWTRAQAEARAVLAARGSRDLTQILTFGPGVRVLGGATANHSSWRGALEALAPTLARASYGELGEAIRTLAAGDPAPITVHVISDFQRSAAPERFADLGLPAGASLVTHDVAATPRANWCIERVEGDRRIHGVSPVSLEVTIAGFDTPAATRRLELRIGERVVRTAEVNVPPAGRVRTRFDGLDLPRGYSRAEVRLTPPDALPADDVSFVSLERTGGLSVLFLRAAEDTRADLYYRAALEAGAAGMFTVQASTAEAAQTLSLDPFAFVVLYDLPRLPALLEGRLRRFVEGGQSALIVAGPAVAREKKLPWIEGVFADAGRADRPLHATLLQSAHKAMKDAGGLADVRFFHHVRHDVPAERVLARLGDGAPLLFEVRKDAGRVLVATSPFDTTWNDWPVHASFVPFVVGTARWLAGLEDTRAQATIGDVLDLDRGGAAGSADGNAPADPSVSIQVIDPAGRRALSLAASVSQRKVALDQAGFYEVRRQGHSEDVAVNPDVRESDLAKLDAETLERWKATGSAPSGTASAAARTERRDLSPLILWGLLALVLIESTLANRYLRA